MSYEFPPATPVSVSMATLGIHAALLVLALASLAGLLVKRRRPARRMDLVVWLLVVLLATLLGLSGLMREASSRPFLVGFMLLVWLVVGIASAMTWRELLGIGRAPASLVALVSLGALLMLILLLLPGVPSARQAAWRMQCGNNLKQIALALHNWHEFHGRLPDTDSGSEPPRSWRVSLLPYLERADLFDRYEREQPWDSAANLPLARTEVSGLHCPLVPDGFRRDDALRLYTAYALLAGPQTAFPDGRGVTWEEITGGSSNLIMVTEASGREIVWTEPRDVDVGREALTVNAPGDRSGRSAGILSAYHPGGVQVAMADGSVQFLTQSIDPQVLRSLTRASEQVKW